MSYRQHRVERSVIVAADEGTWHPVVFSQAFLEAPSVQVTTASEDLGGHANVRIRKVTVTGFDVRFDVAPSAPRDVHWLAIGV